MCWQHVHTPRARACLSRRHAETCLHILGLDQGIFEVRFFLRGLNMLQMLHALLDWRWAETGACRASSALRA